MDKKPLFDSDIDPKRIKNVADGLRRQREFESARMLDGYADMLEAQEKAVPVAYALFTENGLIRVWSRDWFGDAHRTPVNPTPLYTHPAPADAERLAEALRRTCRKMKTFSRTGALDGAVAVWVDEIEAVLAAHCAQAQPPAASVTDAMVNAAMRADFCGHNVADALMCGTDWNTEVMRAALEAALAAQENPNG